MSENQQNDVTDDELQESEGQPLPDPEAMSTVPLPDPLGGVTFPFERPTNA